MSYDVSVQDIPSFVQHVKDMPSDTFHPKPIGRRSDILDVITAVAPEADFSDPSWGKIVGEGWNIEVNLGHEEDMLGFLMFPSEEEAATNRWPLSPRSSNAELAFAPDSETGLFEPGQRLQRPFGDGSDTAIKWFVPTTTPCECSTSKQQPQTQQRRLAGVAGKGQPPIGLDTMLNRRPPAPLGEMRRSE